MRRAGSCLCLVVFFFSSRRRHTRCSRDWSSDVCSTDLRGYYDYWDTGSRATLRELLANEGAAVAAAQAVAPGFEPWEYFGYTRRQYRRIRELDAFLRRAAAPLLDETGLGLRLRFLSG